jgi:ubiquinone biosynthesis protein COQ9
MELIHLNKIDNSNIKIANSIKQFNSLIKLLNDKNLTLNVIKKINDDITELNSSQVMGTALSHLIKKKQNKIIKLTEKELKIVPKNYYRNLWMVLGMSAFGLPLGVAFGLSLGNIGLLAIGLPIGMAIGTLVGSKLDKKALESGKQLDIELK